MKKYVRWICGAVLLTAALIVTLMIAFRTAFRPKTNPAAPPMEVSQDVPGVPLEGIESSSDDPNSTRPISSIEAIDLTIPPSINDRLAKECGDAIPAEIKAQALVDEKGTILLPPSFGIRSSIHGPTINFDKGTEITPEPLAIDMKSENLRHIAGSLRVWINGHETLVNFDATIHLDSEDPIHVKDAHITWTGPIPIAPSK